MYNFEFRELITERKIAYTAKGAFFVMVGATATKVLGERLGKIERHDFNDIGKIYGVE